MTDQSTETLPETIRWERRGMTLGWVPVNSANVVRCWLETPSPEPAPVEVTEPEAAEDDRVSVDGEVTLVEGPPATATTPDENDTDGLESKTKKELQDILTKRGIPFSKSDAKGALISLLKATA
jgi:hypothetical protein